MGPDTQWYFFVFLLIVHIYYYNIEPHIYSLKCSFCTHILSELEVFNPLAAVSPYLKPMTHFKHSVHFSI